MELTQNVNVLKDFRLDLSLASVHGIQLGMPKTSIPTGILPESNSYLWLRSEKGFSVRFSNVAPHNTVEFLLFPEMLTPLELHRKKDIQLCFGPADAIEKRSGNSVYFYEDQQMIVSWNNDKNQLFGIYLGDNIIEQTCYSVQDFLNLYHEFKQMEPDTKRWSSECLITSNESVYYRFLRLQALVKAFNLGTDLLTDFHERRFLQKRTIEDFKPFYKDIEKYVQLSDSESKLGPLKPLKDMNPAHFQMMLQSFFRFSEQMRNILHFNSGWLEAGSVTARYSIHKTNAILNSINVAALEELNHLLHKIIDPQGRVFTQSDLIEQYDFPDVDLHSIDIENY